MLQYRQKRIRGIPRSRGTETRYRHGGNHPFILRSSSTPSALTCNQVHDADELDAASLDAALRGDDAAAAASATAAAADDKKFAKPSRPGGGGRRLMK